MFFPRKSYIYFHLNLTLFKIKKNLETGEIVFMESLTCRKDIVIGENIPFMKTCGSRATYFEEN